MAFTAILGAKNEAFRNFSQNAPSRKRLSILML